MTSTTFSKNLAYSFARILKSGRMLALAIVAAFATAAIQPAQAQSAASDNWKSVAIIGGSTAAGAIIGHKVAGRTGALVGAGVGATAGYEIDRRRRANEYYNQSAYGDGGYYPNNYPSNGGYYGNGGYNGPYDNNGYPYPSGYQSNYRSRR